MIVSERNKYIFIHIPKNGGTTIESLFMDHLVPSEDLHISEQSKLPDNRALFGIEPQYDLKKHITSPKLRIGLGPEGFDSRFSFAFSRNPYSRAFSAYNFVKFKAKADLNPNRKRQPASVEQVEARKKFLTLTFDEVCRDLSSVAADNGLFRLQCYWLPDPDSVDWVGRLENLGEDMRAIYARVGLPEDNLADLPTANQKSAPGAWRGMSRASADAIRDFYEMDFERFGYDRNFDAPDEAAPRPMPNAPIARNTDLKRLTWHGFLGLAEPVNAEDRKARKKQLMDQAPAVKVGTKPPMNLSPLERAERLERRAAQLRRQAAKQNSAEGA